jgi:hypothetical protein
VKSVTKRACYHRAVMPSGRAARAFLAGCALTVSLVAPAHTSSPPIPFDELLTELTVAVAGVLGQNEQVQVVASDTALARDLGLRLARRGVRVIDAAQADAAVITVTCSDTIAERLCAAEVQRGDARNVLSVHRPYGAQTRPPAIHFPVTLVLELRPLLAETTPILDVAFVGPHLLVLHPSTVARYQRADQGWRVQEARPIVSKRAWPRDLRGRLAVDGTRLEVFLPGVSCRGSVDSFDLTCGDEDRPWPVGFENTGIVPDRNYFVSSQGERYYTAVPLGSEAGARWLAATADGRLVFLDDAGQSLDGLAGSSDEVVGLPTPCASGDLVLVPVRSSQPGDGDALRLFRVAGRRLLAVTPPAALPGTLTALWARTGANSATAVCHNPMTGLYEAFQVGVSCGR